MSNKTLNSGYDLPEIAISLEAPAVQQIHRNAVQLTNRIQIASKNKRYLQYYYYLCKGLFKAKLHNLILIVGNEGLEIFQNDYLPKHVDNIENRFSIDNSLNHNNEFILFIVGKISKYLGRSIEIIHGNEAGIKFYKNYLKNGYDRYGLKNSLERLSMLYKKNKMNDKAKSVINYYMNKLILTQKDKMKLHEMLDKLNNGEDNFSKKIQIKIIQKPKDTINVNNFPFSLSTIEYAPTEINVCTNLNRKDLLIFKTENTYWWSIQSLLYYEEIFANIKENGVSNDMDLNGMPTDFFKENEFYNRRKDILHKKNKYLENSDISKIIVERFNKYKYKNIRHLILHHITIEGLKIITKVIPNKVIVKICDRINKNISAYRTGLPDLFITDNKNYQFIEVKKYKETIHFDQKLWLNYLYDLGVDVAVYRVK